MTLTTETISQTEQQLVVFDLASELYGVDIGVVREIIRMQELTQLPQTSFYVEGVINLRGKVTPVIDLRKRLSLPVSEQDQDTRILVVDVEDQDIGVIVNSVVEVLRISSDSIEPTSSVMTLADSDNLLGIVKMEDRLIILLDLAQALAEDDMDLASYEAAVEAYNRKGLKTAEKVDVKSIDEAEEEPEVEDEPKTQAKAQARSESKAEAKSKGAARSEPKAEAKSKGAARSEPKAEAKSKNTAKSEPTPEPDSGPEEQNEQDSAVELNIELLEQSFAKLVPRGDEFVESFFDRLFDMYPEMKPMFAKTDMKKQRKNLLESLVMVVKNLRMPDVLGPALANLGERHKGLGAQEEHYAMVGEALLRTLEEYFEDDWTPELKSAWADAYDAMVAGMTA